MAQNRRLIDADALKENRLGYFAQIDNQTGKWPCVLLKEIRDAPTVDAVEVVRCEKCIHGIPEEDANIPNCYMCVEAAEYDPESGLYAGFTSYHTGDFFCGYGERRNNG